MDLFLFYLCKKRLKNDELLRGFRLSDGYKMN